MPANRHKLTWSNIKGSINVRRNGEWLVTPPATATSVTVDPKGTYTLRVRSAITSSDVECKSVSTTPTTTARPTTTSRPSRPTTTYSYGPTTTYGPPPTTAPPVIPPILDCGRWTAHDGALMIGLKKAGDVGRYRAYDKNGKLLFDTKISWPQGSQVAGGTAPGVSGAWPNWSNQPNVAFFYGHNATPRLSGAVFAAIAKVTQISKDGYESPGKACDFYGNSSPVALDLDGSGAIERAGHGVSFDLAGDGSAQRLDNWFGAGDGILVDTRVAGPVSGKALFGDEGGRFADGYAKLATLDSNGDGAVSGAELVGLGVWNDNGDAVVQAGEIRSLAAVGVTSISTSHTAWTSTATTTSGPIATEDVWFNAED